MSVIPWGTLVPWQQDQQQQTSARTDPEMIARLRELFGQQAQVFGALTPPKTANAGDRMVDPDTGQLYESAGTNGAGYADWIRNNYQPAGDWFQMLNPDPSRRPLVPSGPNKGLETPEYWRRLLPGFPTS